MKLVADIDEKVQGAIERQTERTSKLCDGASFKPTTLRHNRMSRELADLYGAGRAG